jgi:hypothetical protein
VLGGHRYHKWRSLQCGITDPIPGSHEAAYANQLASVRKDIGASDLSISLSVCCGYISHGVCCVLSECTFGVLKKRWRILKSDIELHSMVDVENIFLTCCCLHNELLGTFS